MSEDISELSRRRAIRGLGVLGLGYGLTRPSGALAEAAANEAIGAAPTDQLPSLKRFGARGDGASDDSGAFARAGAGVTFLPPGQYRISGNVVEPGKIFQALGGTQIVSSNHALVYSSCAYGVDALTRETGVDPANLSYSGRNCAFGTHALSQNTTGHHNHAFGWGAGQNITTGSQNTLVGMAAGNAITTGASNTAVGTSALLNCTTGHENTAVGRAAGLALTTAMFNVLVGRDTAFAKATGDCDTLVGAEIFWGPKASGGFNTALGWRAFHAGDSTSFGTHNVSVGAESSYNLGDGNANTAVGQRALFSATTPNDIVAVGQQALYSLTTGARNTAIGTRAFGSTTTGLTTGADNVALGWQAGYSVQGNHNIAIGSGAMSTGTAQTGSNNVVIGGLAGGTLTSGSGNTLIGHGAQPHDGAANGQLAIYSGGAPRIVYDGATILLAGAVVKSLPVSVRQLPSAGSAGAGARAFVVDSMVAGAGNFGAPAMGGGSHGVPVYSDGRDWLIG